MGTSRRSFLITGTVAAASSALFARFGKLRSARAQTPEVEFRPGSDPLSFYRMAAFTPYIGTTFSILFGEITLGLQLVRVTNLRRVTFSPDEDHYSGWVDTRGECFSLSFCNSDQASLPQETYTMTHDALGTFDLFIVPMGSQANGDTNYEAIINHSFE